MASRKLLTNATPHSLQITLIVRRSDDPRETAGRVDCQLPPKESRWVEYGNNVDIYLNGIDLVAQGGDGAIVEQRNVVIQRGSPFDNMLNMHNAVDFSLENGALQIRTRQV